MSKNKKREISDEILYLTQTRKELEEDGMWLTEDDYYEALYVATEIKKIDEKIKRLKEEIKNK